MTDPTKPKIPKSPRFPKMHVPKTYLVDRLSETNVNNTVQHQMQDDANWRYFMQQNLREEDIKLPVSLTGDVPQGSFAVRLEIEPIVEHLRGNALVMQAFGESTKADQEYFALARQVYDQKIGELPVEFSKAHAILGALMEKSHRLEEKLVESIRLALNPEQMNTVRNLAKPTKNQDHMAIFEVIKEMARAIEGDKINPLPR